MLTTNSVLCVLLCISARYIVKTHGQCTFGTTFNGTTWHDGTRGDVTFSQSTMSKWTHSGASVLQFPTWTCVNFTADTYIVMRTTTTVILTSGSSAYAYICMKLTAITANSFLYYLQSLQQPQLAYERVTISTLATLTQSDVCDSSTTVPAIEYHVLVKSELSLVTGFESNAAIRCPNSLLFSADYVYYGSDGTTACDTSADNWNVCANQSVMTFDYSTCSQQIAFSSSGVLWCIASVVSTYDYTVVYNNDTTVDGSTTERFACIASESTLTYASVVARNCTITQTPSTFARGPEHSTNIGHRLVIGTKYQTCGSTEDEAEGLTPGAIVAIVISLLYIISMWILTSTFIIIILVWIGFQFIVILLEMTGNLETRKSPTLSYIDIIEPNKDLITSSKTDIITPSDVELEKENTFKRRGTLLPIRENSIVDKKVGRQLNGKQSLTNEKETADLKRKTIIPAIHKPTTKPVSKLTPR